MDMIIYGHDGGFEYDLRVRPHTDASDLRLEFSGSVRMQLTADGDLRIEPTNGRELLMKKPKIYEEWPSAGAAPKLVAGGYEIGNDGTIGFAVGSYDPSATLVIDPSLSVSYSTFLGGAGSEASSSIGLDSAGNVYVGGTTTNPTSFAEGTTAAFGPGIGSNSSGGTNAEYFVAKINPNLTGTSSLVYLTFLGGSAGQSGGLITVDAAGNVAITGTTTSPDFPVTDGSLLTSGTNDVTVSEIDPTGSVLLFSTLFGGSEAESQWSAGGIAFDAMDNIYVATDTSSTDLPVTANVFQSTFAGPGSDGFLAEFQPSSTPSLVYCSYLGTNASGQIGVGGVAIDTSGDVYIAGYTSNDVSGFPVKNAFQTAYGGDPSDAFLMKILPASQAAADVIYATLLGGSGLDKALAVALDDSMPANAYITGTTGSSNFPTNGTTSGYQPALHFGATGNAFLSVIAQNPSTGVATLAYSTYLGGSASDSGLGLAAIAFNSIYLTGTANSWDFPWHDNLQPFNGSSDAFVAKFNPSVPGAASLIYATPLGGTAPPGLAVSAGAAGVAADAFGDVYVAGQTTAADFPTAVTTGGVANGFQPICASCQNFPEAADVFMVALHENSTPLPSVYFNSRNVIFPAAPVGTQNAPQPVAVHNGGEASLTITSLGITGPNASDFSLIGPGACNGATISVGGECSFEVGFVPSTTGAETAVVSISDNAPGNPQVLELIGAGQGPLISLSTTTLTFGPQPENSNSQSEAVIVTNVGNQALALQSPAESGPDVAQFFLSGKDITCTSSLAASTSCAIGVVFTPTAIGTFHAQVTLTDNSGGIANATQVIALVGTATGPAPNANVTPSTLAFGGIQTGTASGTQQVTLLNSGTTALNITDIAISGANAQDFAATGSGAGMCPLGSSSLAAGASCSVSIRFAPAASDSLGAKTATFSIVDNAAGSPHTVALSGTATGAASVQISPASVHFAAQSSGTPSAPQTITILNAGSSSLSLNGFGMSGTNSPDFSQTNNCPPSLRGGSTCSVSVVFDPTFQSNASRSASLTIADNASGSPQSVPLSGSATQAGIQIVPTSINFAGQQAASASSPQTITVTNTGTGNLSFSSVAIVPSSDFIVGANTCSSAQTPPGGNCTIQVSFSPACTNGTAARSASVSLADNVVGSPQTVALSGTATGDFCFAAATGATVTPGQTAGYTVTVNSPTAYKGTVSLTCANFPSASTCTVPASVTVPSQFAVTVITAVSSTGSLLAVADFHQSSGPRAKSLVGLALLLAWFWFFASYWVHAGSARAYSRRTPAFCLMIASMALWIAACGTAGSDPPAATVAGTPAGSYTLTVTGTSTNTTGTVNLPLTVQ